jgi:hypothetical protein
METVRLSVGGGKFIEVPKDELPEGAIVSEDGALMLEPKLGQAIMKLDCETWKEGRAKYRKKSSTLIDERSLIEISSNRIEKSNSNIDIFSHIFESASSCLYSKTEVSLVGLAREL